LYYKTMISFVIPGIMQMKQDPKAHTLYLLIGDVS